MFFEKEKYMNIKSFKLKVVFIAFIVLCIFVLVQPISLAGSGKVVIHWLESSRKPTLTDAKSRVEKMGYWVESCENWDNYWVLDHLSTSRIFVAHTHGGPGRQVFNGKTLAGTNGGSGMKSVSSLGSNAAKNLRIAIYYGCSTGNTTSTYGNICQQTVNKGAQAAVAWRVTTYVSEVNEWNKQFFEKAKTANIVESYRHADYWTRFWKGNTAGDRMQNNRNESGNINGWIN